MVVNARTGVPTASPSKCTFAIIEHYNIGKSTIINILSAAIMETGTVAVLDMVLNAVK
jgi:hypothetical protein